MINWTAVLGFPELPGYLTVQDLRAVLPWFLRLYKIKGTMVPVYLLTERVFEGYADVDVDPYNEQTGRLEILVKVDPSFVPPGMTTESYDNYISVKWMLSTMF